MTAICFLGNHGDYTAVTRLPSNTTELVCVVRGKLDEDALDLKSLWRLKKLVLASQGLTSYFKAKVTRSISAIYRNDLLQNLTGLTSFGLNIPTRFLSPRLLDPVPNLQHLDFSHSFLQFDGALYLFMKNMTLSGNRLETLNLTGVQRQYSSKTPTPILLRDHIFIPIQNYPIKTLDLFDNEIMAMQAGMTAYLPELDQMRIGSRRLLYIQDLGHLPSRGCFNLEMLLHPSIRELYIRFPYIPNQNANARARRSLLKAPEGIFGLRERKEVVKCLFEALLHPQKVCANQSIAYAKV